LAKAGLLKPNTPTPDFEFKGLDGSIIKLSDYLGKVVLLNFWRVGCPACREEIPQLEMMYRKYKDSGLVVIGFNCSDDTDIAFDLLSQFSVSSPNIVNKSSQAQDVYFHIYQTLPGFSAVPLNYIIDREGKIFDAWYGLIPEDSLLKKIHQFGFKLACVFDKKSIK
jgi:peroxiredoxin